jgi:hypothetical protein
VALRGQGRWGDGQGQATAGGRRGGRSTTAVWMR